MIKRCQSELLGCHILLATQQHFGFGGGRCSRPAISRGELGVFCGSGAHLIPVLHYLPRPSTISKTDSHIEQLGQTRENMPRNSGNGTVKSQNQVSMLPRHILS